MQSYLDRPKEAPKPAAPAAAPAKQFPSADELPPRPERPDEQRVRMTRLRQRIAQRLKEAQDTAAMLTTFNEIDMTAVMSISLKVVSIAAVSCASFRRWAMRWRRRVMRTRCSSGRSGRGGSSSAEGNCFAGAAAGAAGFGASFGRSR